MMPLNSSSTVRQAAIPKWVVVLFLVLSFLGFLDAAYLTVEHVFGQAPACSLVKGCDVVTTSMYATIWGVPIASLGAAYYLLVFVFSVLVLETRRKILFSIAVFCAFFGFLFSLWLVYLQAFVLHAFCVYCLFSAGISTALFFLGVGTLLINRRALSRRDESSL